MERIHALIGQLHQQSLQQSHPAQLLLTVQLLQAELVRLQQKNGTLGTSKVAVTLPVNLNFSEEVVRPHLAEAAPVAEPAPMPQPSPASEPAPALEMPAPQPPVATPAAEEVSPYAPKQYSLNKPRVVVHEEPEPIPAYAPAATHQVLNPALSAVAEAPTLDIPRREVNEAVGQRIESLNDRLKQEKTEVVHVLKDTPIKDLRKGIGINDRFSFVSELFRGDEAMYERSIKTINGFHALSEAEYWINRELKFKLGWSDSKDLVQHFYQLVRRRFSSM